MGMIRAAGKVLGQEKDLQGSGVGPTRVWYSLGIPTHYSFLQKSTPEGEEMGRQGSE